MRKAVSILLLCSTLFAENALPDSDEEAAKVVQRIFGLCIAGKGPMQIAKILTVDKVLTVTAYSAKQKGQAERASFPKTFGTI